MKSKDLQQLVLSKYESGDTIAKIYRDLNGAISYDTMRRWCNMIGKTRAIQLSAPSGPPRIICTKQMIQKSEKSLKAQEKSFLLEYWRMNLIFHEQMFAEY